MNENNDIDQNDQDKNNTNDNQNKNQDNKNQARKKHIQFDEMDLLLNEFNKLHRFII